MILPDKVSNHPIFILEGPDGVGKTTLALELQKLTGGRYVHLTYRFRSKIDVYHTATLKLIDILSRKQPVILDRWWVSEIVYADAYRGGSKFIKSYFALEHAATVMGAIYVMCLPYDRARYLSFYYRLQETRTEMYSEGLERVYDGYKAFFQNYMVHRENVLRYDMFDGFHEDKELELRTKALRYTAQEILAFAADYRSLI